MSQDAPPPATEGLSSMQVNALAVACALAIATLYYSQPLLPLIGATFGTGESLTSQIVMLGQIGYALGLLLFVPIGDRFDRRRLILILLALNTVMLAACAAAPSFAALAAATLVAGLTTVTPQIVIPTVAGMAAPERRGRSVAVLLAGMSAGLLLGRTLSGLVGEAAGWRAVFAMAMLLNLLIVMIVWRLMPATVPTTGLPYLRLLRSLWRLLADHATLRAACATGFFAFGAFSAIWATLAFLLARPPYQFGADAVGLFGLIGVVSMIAAPAIGRLTDGLGARVMIGAGGVTLLAAFGFVAQAGSLLWTLILGLALIDLGYRMVLLANQTRIYPLAPDAQSRLNTLFMTFVFLGGAVGSACGAAVVHGSWTGVALAGGGLAAAGLVVHLASLRRRG